MNPGDFLYFPAGIWHKVETLETGVSLNVSLMGMSYADHIASSIKHILNKEERFREVPCNFFNDAESKMESLLKEVVGGGDGSGSSSLLKRLSGSAILPPFIKGEAANTEIVEGGDDKEEKSSDSGEELEEEEESNASEEEESEEEEEEENGEEEDEAIALKEFSNAFGDLAARAALGNNEPPIKAIFSPLGLLLQQSEVSGSHEPIDKHSFIVNINYAGDENYASTIRKVFLCNDEERIIMELILKYQSCKKKRIEVDPFFYSLLEGKGSAEAVKRVFSALFYFGFLVQG
jgi:hypothetical protein